MSGTIGPIPSIERAETDSEPEVRQAALRWALADLDGLLARGVIDARTHTALRLDYEERLRAVAPVPGEVAWSGSSVHPLPPPHPTDAPPVAPAVRGPAPVVLGPEINPGPTVPPDAAVADPNARPSAAAPGGTGVAPAGSSPSRAAEAAPGGGIADLGVNVLLFLGAFFVVIASLIFVAYNRRELGGITKAAIMLGFTAAFLGAGAGCLRVPKVRLAGQVFLGIGAFLTPLAVVALYNFVLREREFSAPAVWAWGSALCAAFYGALALRRLGRLYAVAAVVAIVSAWWGGMVALDVPARWLPAAALVPPLLLLAGGRLAERTPPLRETIGPVPAVAAQLLAPLGIMAGLVLAVLGEARWEEAAALALATLFYVAAAWSQPHRIWRGLQVAAALVVGGLLLAAMGFAARLPERGYAALALGYAWFALGLAALARRRAASWAPIPLVASWAGAGLLLLPWGFLVTDRHPIYWAVIFGGVAAYALVALWGLRRPWTLYPLALAALLTIFHALRIGFAPEPALYGRAFAVIALVPVAVLSLLRRRGIPRGWDRQLIVIAQLVAAGAAALAVGSGERATTALVLAALTLGAAAIVSIERRPELLALPALWGLGAVAAALALAGVERRWAPAVFAGIGAGLALGLQGWRGVPRERRGDWYMAHRWVAGGWAIFGTGLAAVGLTEPLEGFLASGLDLLELVLHTAYGPAGLATALCGAALAFDAIFTLRRPTGYGASAVLMAAALMGIARLTPNNPQAYAVPLGLYLLGLSVYVAYERDLGPVRMPAANGLLAAAIAVILGTTLAQSLVQPWRYILLGLGEGLALLGATLFLRRRYGVAITLGFLTLTALRALFDAARALPYWAIIGLLGLALLGGGLFVLLRRERIERWGSSAANRWSRLT